MPRELKARIAAPIEVICDFDGTIARPDTVDQLLEALADPSWRLIEAEWQRGEIDSRQCMSRQIPLIRGGWHAIERFLDENVTVHPSFAPFAAWCTRRGIALRVASEGLDRVIQHVLSREGVTARSVWATRLQCRADDTLALDFSHASGQTRCGAAHCKCELFRRTFGDPVQVLVGDGRSDFCAAKHASLVFARSALLSHCRENGLRYVSFERFDTVREVLERQLAPAARGKAAEVSSLRDRRRERPFAQAGER